MKNQRFAFCGESNAAWNELSSRKPTYKYTVPQPRPQGPPHHLHVLTIPCRILSLRLILFIQIVSTAAPSFPKLSTTLVPDSASVVAFPGIEIGHLAKRGPFKGRQTKNAVCNAQALDFNEKPLAIHYKFKVLQAVNAFERGLKGGIRCMDAIGSLVEKVKKVMVTTWPAPVMHQPFEGLHLRLNGE